MLRPALDDTIVAISSGWRAAPLGIVRISGPDAPRLLERLLPSRRHEHLSGRAAFDATLFFDDLRVAARVLAFRAPASFTGQDVIELYVPGSLPLLRRLADWLVAQGARPALPGEFSARAYLNGKLNSAQAAGVLGLVHAVDGVSARQAARLARSAPGRDLSALRDELLDLLARLEAGIDFVDEEDVRFITAAELRARLDSILTALPPTGAFNRRERPHVVLAGLPNAGKSSLFNALVGQQRTIVSPVAGTTRDVVAAEIEVNACAIVLQDSAGIASSAAELDQAANRAADAAVQAADLVLWLHDASQPWSGEERRLLAAAPAERIIHVGTKVDLAASAEVPSATAEIVRTSAKSGYGLPALRSAIASGVRKLPTAPLDSQIALMSTALMRARALLKDSKSAIPHPELVALEIRTVLESEAEKNAVGTDEAVLAAIFSKFCIGK